MVTGADFNEHVGEGSSGDEEFPGRFGIHDRNVEGQPVVEMSVVNISF